jgi:hypothetical protein
MRNNLSVLLRHKALLSRVTGPSFTGTKRVMIISMEQSSSSEASTSSVSREVAGSLWNPTVRYGVRMGTIVGQMASVHTLPTSLLKIHLNIIRTSMSRYPKRSPSCTLRRYNPIRISPLLQACHDHPSNIW